MLMTLAMLMTSIGTGYAVSIPSGLESKFANTDLRLNVYLDHYDEFKALEYNGFLDCIGGWDTDLLEITGYYTSGSYHYITGTFKVYNTNSGWTSGLPYYDMEAEVVYKAKYRKFGSLWIKFQGWILNENSFEFNVDVITSVLGFGSITRTPGPILVPSGTPYKVNAIPNPESWDFSHSFVQWKIETYNTHSHEWEITYSTEQLIQGFAIYDTILTAEFKTIDLIHASNFLADGYYMGDQFKQAVILTVELQHWREPAIVEILVSDGESFLPLPTFSTDNDKINVFIPEHWFAGDYSVTVSAYLVDGGGVITPLVFIQGNIQGELSLVELQQYVPEV